MRTLHKFTPPPILPNEQEKLQKYLDYLEKWNQLHNITRIAPGQETWQKHILDCLTVLEFAKPYPLQLDIGSGAGLPGIILAIFQPHHKIHLVEKIAKKVAFLQQVKNQLALDNVELFCEDINSWQTKQKYSLIISRAFAALPLILKIAEQRLSDGGRVIFMGGRELIEPRQINSNWTITAEKQIILSQTGEEKKNEGIIRNVAVLEKRN